MAGRRTGSDALIGGHSLGRVFLTLFAPLTLTALAMGCESRLISVIPPSNLQICAASTSPCPPPPSQVTLLEGEEEALRARLTGPDGELLSGRPVSWSSDDLGVAAVTPQGLLRGVLPGLTVVRAEAEGLRASVAVAVLQGPTIALSAQLLQLAGPSGEPPLEVVVEVGNVGNGSLSGLVASVQTDVGGGEGWLVSALQGEAAPTTLSIQVLLEDLSPGLYTGRVAVADPAASNSPQTIEVEVSVEDPLPRIDLSPTVAFLSAASGTVQPAILDVSVDNGGGGVLEGLMTSVTYVSGGSPGWLSTSFAGAQVPTTLEISANGRFLAPGTYVADVLVTATSAPAAAATVRVTFTVR